MREIIGTAWRSSLWIPYGIVAVRREDGWKAYLSAVRGDDELADAQLVAEWGAPLAEREARAFFPEIDPELPYAS